MRTIREVLRLKWQCGLSNRDIAASCHIGATAVLGYIRRAELAGLSWPLPESLQDAALEQMLFPPLLKIQAKDRAMPNWAEVHKQMKRKGVTLQLLAEEHRRANPTGYAYSQFCKHYSDWVRAQEATVIQEHKAGDKLFVDYAGVTMPITDPKTGEAAEAQIFVAALGASNYTFVDATMTQSLPDWIGSHVRCFAFLGGVTRLVVPDNLKSAVTSPCRYEPDINPTYAKLAAHYGTAVVPARVRKPRDKAKVENAVLQVERNILARLRNHTFHSLAELNRAIAELLAQHNDRDTRSLGSSRTDLFLSIDKPALRRLPERPFGDGSWGKARVSLDYHVVVEYHRYSVPYTHKGDVVETYLTSTTVEIYADNERIASHRRSDIRYGFTTVDEHLPPKHRGMQMSEAHFVSQAGQHGPHTKQLITEVLASRPVVEQSYRSCLGIPRLAEKYGSKRIEDAARRAVSGDIATYKSVAAILKNGLDRVTPPAPEVQNPPIIHENIRGEGYYVARNSQETNNA